MKVAASIITYYIIQQTASGFINSTGSPPLQCRSCRTITSTLTSNGSLETKTATSTELSLFRKKKDAAAATTETTIEQTGSTAVAQLEGLPFPLGEATPTAEEDDIKITSASVLPPVPESALIIVYYAEQAIAALGTIGEVIEAYHAGMTFEISNYDELIANGEISDVDLVPREFTVEWYAENFPFGAFLPQVIGKDSEPTEEADADDNNPKNNPPSASKTGLQWENESWAYYSPEYKPSRWSKGRTRIGTVAGSAMPAYGAWVVDYCTANPGYTAFEVWDRPYLETGVTRRLRSSTTCSSFTQGSMEILYELGKGQRFDEGIEGVGMEEAMVTNKELIMRSYIPIISKSRPTKADMDDAQQADEVREFFIELNKAARKVDGEGLSTSEFVRLLANKLETFYVYDTPKDDYYRVDLDPPYFAVSSLYQPVSLPWQRLELLGNGELQDPAAFAGSEADNFAVELGAAVKGAVDLAKRRLPPVLKKQLRAKISNEGIIGVAILAGAGALGLFVASPPNLDVDISFVSGVAVGVVGAKLLL